MPLASALAAWLRRVCLTDYGYTFALPALVATSAVLSHIFIRRIAFTEIDFQTYIGQAALFLAGERDYTKLDPEGGSGPCVYPAAHLYVFSFFHWLTGGGKNILPAQNVFAGLLTANNLIVALLYREAGMPPIAVLPLVLSKRIYSIFLLRMYNDPIAIFGVYGAMLAAVRGRWKWSAVLFSLGLGVKMNVLLFLPGLAAAVFYYRGLPGAVSYVAMIAFVQIGISLPFTLHDPKAYLSGAFDFSRSFLYVWTVNWRFVPEETFLSPMFAKSLLALHLILLALFGLYRWTGIAHRGPTWIYDNLANRSKQLTQSDKVAILCAAFTSNVIGILCSRSLHYQFYSWYFHQVPLLLWVSKLPLVVKLGLPVVTEWCWNAFPSTRGSSGVLLGCHVVLVAGCLTVPRLVNPGEQVEEKMGEVEEDEVELLLTDEQRTSREDSDTVSASEDEPTPQEDALTRLQEVRAAKIAKETKLRNAFRRRLATRRKILSLLGRLSLLLRPLLVLLSVVLIFVVPHPRSPVSKGTYVDENALQPGQAKVYWDYFDVTYSDMLSEKVGFLGSASSEARADFVYSELQSYGLEVHRQGYSYDTEMALGGTNVYARSATPRIDGREAVILTASWRSRWTGENDPFNATTTIDPNGRTNVRGVASILALARYLSTQAHLSKDLIFVVSDGHLEGIHAWTSAYFGDVPAGLRVEPVVTGGSQVWNAISIDYPADSFSSLVVQYEGFDGQLPNMDVINTVIRIAESVAGGMPTSFSHKASTSLLKEPAQTLAQRLGISLRVDVEYELGAYEDGLRSALRQVGFGVSGQASGPHGFFQRHHVDAITLYAVPATGPYGFYHLGRLIESFVRSMSNLLERLHHSQFFYLLLSPRRFVPIGTAILIPLFLSISLTIGGLGLWFAEEKVSRVGREAVLKGLGPAVGGEGDVQPETPTLGWYRDQVMKKYLNGGGEEGVDQHADALRESMRPVGMALACTGSAGVMGVGTVYLCRTLAGPVSPKLTAGFAAILLHPLATSFLLRFLRSTNRRRRIGALLLSFAYLQAGMLTAVLSVLNFALATILALLTYSALRIASGRPSPSNSSTVPRSALAAVLRFALVTLLNPVLWVVLFQALGMGWEAGGIGEAMTHWKLFGSATVPILCVGYLPIVLQAQLGVLLKI